MAVKIRLKNPFKTIIGDIRVYLEYRKIPMYNLNIEQLERVRVTQKHWALTLAISYIITLALFIEEYVRNNFANSVMLLCLMILGSLAIFDAYNTRDKAGLYIYLLRKDKRMFEMFIKGDMENEVE